MPHKVAAFRRRKERQRLAHEFDDLVEAARAGRTEPRLELGEGHLDWIEVGAVGRQEAEPGPDAFDRGLDGRLLVQREVVEHHDITGPQRRREHLLDVGQKGGVVERTVEDGGRVQPIPPQRRDDRLRVPVATGRVVAQADAARTAPVGSKQVRGDAGLIDEDVAGGVVQRQRLAPASPSRGDIGPPLFIGVNGFFLA